MGRPEKLPLAHVPVFPQSRSRRCCGVGNPTNVTIGQIGAASERVCRLALPQHGNSRCVVFASTSSSSAEKGCQARCFSAKAT